MVSTNAPLTNVTDGRQRLAGAMTNPFAGAGMAGGNMAGGARGNMAGAGVMGGMMTNNVTSPLSGAGTLPAGGAMGNVDPTGGGSADLGTTGMDYGSAGSGTGSSANEVAGTANQPVAGIGSQGNSVDPATGRRLDGSDANSFAASGQGTSGNGSDYQVGGIGDYTSQFDPGTLDPSVYQKGADAAYQQASEYFAPDFAKQQSDLENQLASQGFARGSEGFTRSIDDMERQQDLARTNAALGAQGVGFGQANQLIQNALAARGQALGARGQDVTMRGQDRGVDSSSIGASATAGAANAAASSANYRADLDSELGLRGLGLQQDNQDFNQMMSLMGGARGGVNAPNFGSAPPLDVGGAYGIASGNQNGALNRAASDRNGLYQLGGSLLGSYFNGGY